MSDWVFAARDRARRRAGASASDVVAICRACGAAYRDRGESTDPKERGDDRQLHLCAACYREEHP